MIAFLKSSSSCLSDDSQEYHSRVHRNRDRRGTRPKRVACPASQPPVCADFSSLLHGKRVYVFRTPRWSSPIHVTPPKLHGGLRYVDAPHFAGCRDCCGALDATYCSTSANRVSTAFQCVKVNPGKWAAVEEWIAATTQAAQSLVDSGAYAMSLVLRTEMPAGTDAQCDYVFVTFYNGLPPAPMSRDEMNKALRKADIQMTAGAYYAKLKPKWASWCTTTLRSTRRWWAAQEGRLPGIQLDECTGCRRVRGVRAEGVAAACRRDGQGWKPRRLGDQYSRYFRAAQRTKPQSAPWISIPSWDAFVNPTAAFPTPGRRSIRTWISTARWGSLASCARLSTRCSTRLWM